MHFIKQIKCIFKIKAFEMHFEEQFVILLTLNKSKKLVSHLVGFEQVKHYSYNKTPLGESGSWATLTF